MFKIKGKKIIFGLILLLITVGIYGFNRGCGKNISLIYRYEKVDKGEVKKTISVAGKLEVLNSHIILSKINGIVKKVYVDFNQHVKKNQLLATLDSSEIDQNITKIEAKMERAALDIAAAMRDLNAKKDLLKDNLISKKGVEQAELNYKKVSSQLHQIRIDHRIMLNKKNYTKIKSPSSGIVITREIDINTPINQNKPLFIIAEDLKKMQLIIHVDESDIGHIKKNQNVSFTVSAFPEKVFNGKISQVRLNPITKAQGQIVCYQSLVTCNNKELLLKPGMTATATVVVSNIKNVLKVSNEAFIVSPVEIEDEITKKFVWKKKSLSLDTLPVERVEVKTGVIGDFNTEIRSKNIKEGDEILIGIQKKLGSNKSVYDL